MQVLACGASSIDAAGRIRARGRVQQEISMASVIEGESSKRLSNYLSAAQARADRWRVVHRLAKSLAAGAGKSSTVRTELADELAGLAPIEDLCGYPGPGLMAAIKERLQT